ncbi:methyl-accepting chemotaxis protein [Chitinimonas sp.]|uniref:methyl-accepting chemotaxis protein n=1 Tax=Chitinimonas sp. TaxID=1934313 RepID=UPI002F9483ED
MFVFSRLNLQHKLQAAFVLVSLLTIGIFTLQSVRTAKEDALQTVDAQLTSAARSYVLLLGQNYHDKLPPRESVDLKQKREEAVRLSRAAEFLKVQYLYSFVVREGKVFYVQASLSAEQEKEPGFEFYLKPSDVPETDPHVLEAIKSGKPQFDESDNPQYGHLRTIIMPVQTSQGETYVACADINADVVAAEVRSAMWAAALTGILLLTASIVASLLLGKLIARPLRQLRDMMRSLTSGSGDLTVRLEVRSQDEIGEIAGYFNTFMGQLREMFLKVSDETVKLTGGVKQISDMAEQLSRDARLQSDMASATAATIEEITVSVDHIAANTQDADRTAQETGRLSDQSADAVTDVAGKVQRAAGSVSELSGVMAELDQHATQISGIVGVIKEIADQTNLLALNAAIEAARAGEQGRGFAVVADEVRKLAERTGSATVEIEQMIGGMRSQSSEAMGRMESTHEAVQQSAGLAQSAAEQIRGIRERMGEVVARVREIAGSAREQSAATTAMAQSAERISVMAQDGDRAILQAKGVIDDLNALAGELREMIGRFKL